MMWRKEQWCWYTCMATSTLWQQALHACRARRSRKLRRALPQKSSTTWATLSGTCCTSRDGDVTQYQNQNQCSCGSWWGSGSSQGSPSCSCSLASSCLSSRILSFSSSTSFFSYQICILVANSSRFMRANCSSLAALASLRRNSSIWWRLAMAAISSSSSRQMPELRTASSRPVEQCSLERRGRGRRVGRCADCCPARVLRGMWRGFLAGILTLISGLRMGCSRWVAQRRCLCIIAILLQSNRVRAINYRYRMGAIRVKGTR